MSVAPLLHQCLEFGIVPVRQRDAGGDEQIAGAAARLRQAFALEAKGAAARGIFRDRQFDRTAERRHAHLVAEHSLIQRDRQVDAQVAAVDLEKGVRRDRDRDQEIPGPVAGRALALPLQPDLLAGDHAGGNLDVELLAGWQPDALLDAVHRLFQRHRHGDGQIEVEPDSAGLELEGAAGSRTRPARRGTAEHAKKIDQFDLTYIFAKLQTLGKKKFVELHVSGLPRASLGARIKLIILLDSIN